MIFPEINYDRVEQIHGMDITFVTSTNRDDQALALLRELGMPFRDGREEDARRGIAPKRVTREPSPQYREIQMARKAMIEKSKRKPKFEVPQHNRCGRCGRSRAFLRRFGLVPDLLPRAGAAGDDSRRAKGVLVTGGQADGWTGAPEIPETETRRPETSSIRIHTSPYSSTSTRIREEHEILHEHDRPDRRHADAHPQCVRIEASPRRHSGVEDEDRDRAHPEGEQLHSGLLDARDRRRPAGAARAAQVRRAASR